MDYLTRFFLMEAKDVALTATLSAVAIVIAYAKGASIPSLPGLVEFMTVIIFVSGFCFGWIVGAIVGAVVETIYMLIPYPFAHPAAWLFTISPILLIVMAALGSLYGILGGVVGKWRNPDRKGRKFVIEMAFWGFLATFIYDISSSIGFYLAYPVWYSSVFQAIYWTFIPLFYFYPPIIHTFTNTIVFAVVAPALIIAIQKLPFYFRTRRIPLKEFST